MPASDGREIARVLREIGLLLQLKGDNPFKTRAYETAAARVEELAPEQLELLVRSGRLDQLPGIGEAIAKKIATLHETGRLDRHEQLRAEFPRGLLDLMHLPELGPRKIVALHRELRISSPEDLARACRDGRVRSLKGFGERTEARLLDAIAAATSVGTRRPLAAAWPLAAELAERVRRAPGVLRAEPAGCVRRFCETVQAIHLVVAGEPTGAFEAVQSWPAVASATPRGPADLGAQLRGGVAVEVHVVPEASFATALLRFTGSDRHLARLQAVARERGVDLGDWRADGTGRYPAFGSEDELYAALGLPFIAPELREDGEEIDAAVAGTLPALVTRGDVRGFVHVHSRYSDGIDSILDLARRARELGGTYLTITDHSRSAGYAGGLDLDRLHQQWREIARVQAQVPEVELLRGAEVDILEDGSLDYPEEVLESLDVVVASVHSRFKLDEDAMTRRVLAAMDNPHVDILGHPTGRLIGKREPYDVRLEAVADKAAQTGVALEVNGNPERLDLSADHVRAARARGARIAITTDAHSAGTLAHLRFSLATARRGWAAREDVVNAGAADEFRARLRSGRA